MARRKRLSVDAYDAGNLEAALIILSEPRERYDGLPRMWAERFMIRTRGWCPTKDEAREMLDGCKKPHRIE